MIQFDAYHCNNLMRVMFKAANDAEHQSDYFYKESTGKIFDSTEEHDIQYHINHLMEHKEHPAKIIQTCHEFQDVCNRLRKESQPKSEPELEQKGTETNSN